MTNIRISLALERAKFELKRLAIGVYVKERQLDKLAICTAECAEVLDLPISEVAYALSQVFMENKLRE